ncbi:hypothetical protein D3C79_512930 [compost metagenome]
MAADNALLLFNGQCIPTFHIMQILLHQGVTAAGKGAVFITHHGEVDGSVAFGVFGAVDKADHGALIEITETLNFIHDGDGIAELIQQLGRQLKAQIHFFGTNV